MTAAERLSAHFSLAEMTVSQTAIRRRIDNTPSAAVKILLTRTAERMEQVRSLLGDVPILVTSGYRSPELDLAIGGTGRSQHCKGEAVDFIAPGCGSPQQICVRILDAHVEFDQLIFEGAWVHISFAHGGIGMRQQALTAHFDHEVVRYTTGIA